MSHEHTFTLFAHAALRRFHNDLLGLFRALDNHHRRTLVALVERTSSAVALVDATERAIIINALCCE
jgi:hypothetical protein